MPSDADRAEPSPRARRRALLVGAFRSIRPEGDDGPFGSQGGFVDTLAPSPYSLATGYLKAYAEADPEVAARWSVDRLDLSQPLDIDDDHEEVELGLADVDRLLAHAPDLIAFSAYCWNEATFREVARELKRRAPDVRVAIGGRATDGDVAAMLRESPAIDLVVVGEGEVPLRELLRHDLDPKGIAGVRYARDGVLVRGAPRASLLDLDEIPSPFAAGILAPPKNGMMLELGRGCLHACGYCTWNADKRLRFFGPARVEAELRLARARGHRHVTFNDSALNYSTAHLVSAIDAIRRADPDGEVRFTYNVRHDCVDDAQLAALARLPTHTMLVGVESFTGRAMLESDRALPDRDSLRRALSALGRAARPPVASIILGMPGDDAESFIQTLEELLSWTEPRGDEPPTIAAVLVSLLQVYPGSKLWRRREELGLKVAARGVPYLLESPDFPARDLAAAKAYLVRRMTQLPDKLKAAEAIVLMEARGGMHPWLARSHVEALLSPWSLGARRGGWTLTRIASARDTGSAALVRFRREGGGEARVRLSLRDRARPSELQTHCYSLAIEPLDAPLPERARVELTALVREALIAGERRAVGAR